MKTCTLTRCLRPALLVASLFAAISIPAATTNRWTNVVSASWSVPTNWSAALLPDNSFDHTLITNDGTKTVILDASTPVANRSIRRLIVSAPGGSTNTLLIEGIPAGEPFSTSGTLLVDRGGMLHVVNSTLSIGNTFDINGNLTLDSGLIDTASSSVGVRVGRSSGATGSVNVNGGILDCFGFRVGVFNNSPGICTINGGTLLSSSVMSMGEIVAGPGTINLLSGRLIATNDITKVGNLAFGELNQSGGSSEFAFLSIGDNAPGRMTVTNGQVTVTPANSADITRVGNFGTAELNISGGSVWLRGEFHVADNPGVNGTVLVSGGQLISTNALVAIGRYGIGEVTVTNASAWFTNTSVGRHSDAVGTLNIQTGASVFCLDDLSIGRFTNSTGYVVVSGGLLGLAKDNVWVGREGMGNLTVHGGILQARGMFVGMSPDGTNAPQGTVNLTGGTALLSSNLLVGTSLLSTGQVTVAGGLLAVTNSTGTGLLNVQSGALVVNQGTLVADAVLLTNSLGQLNLAGGTLQATSMTIANGSPFVVGDGTNPAVLELRGGTFAFAGGLVISPNATVTGCGTIVGSIVNNGTLNTNCGPSLAITSFTKTGTVATVFFSTVPGSNHFLEFKNTLADPTWITIPPGVIGDGNVANKVDHDATNVTRFYRIHLK